MSKMVEKNQLEIMHVSHKRIMSQTHAMHTPDETRAHIHAYTHTQTHNTQTQTHTYTNTHAYIQAELARLRGGNVENMSMQVN